MPRYTIKGDTLQVPIALLGTHEASRNTGHMGIPIKKVPGELAFNYFHEFGRPASRKKLLDKAPFTLKHPWASLGIGAGAGTVAGLPVALLSKRHRGELAILGGAGGMLIGMLASNLRTNSNAREYLKKLHRQGKLKEGNWKVALPVIGITTAIGAGLGAVPVPTGRNKKEKRNDRIRNMLGGAAIGGLVGGLAYLRHSISNPGHIPSYSHTPGSGSFGPVPIPPPIPKHIPTPIPPPISSGAKPQVISEPWESYATGAVNPPPIDPGVVGGVGGTIPNKVWDTFTKNPENKAFMQKHNLPISPNTMEEAKAAYKAKATELHPDKFAAKGEKAQAKATEEFKRLEEWKDAMEDYTEKFSSVMFESFLDELIKSS